MKSLYLDTTKNLVIGLFGDQLQVLDWKEIETNKTSSIVHSEINTLLENNHLAVNQIGKLIYPAGPGSYTGMRIAEGIAHIFDWNNIMINTFYHFDAPELLGFTKYAWMANAYKKEYFVYKFDEGISEKFLVAKQDWEKIYFELMRDGIDIFGLEALNENIKTTHLLIKENGAKLLAKIIEKNLRKDLLYFRNIEDEFKKKEE